MTGKGTYAKIVEMFGIPKLLLILLAGTLLVVLSFGDIFSNTRYKEEKNNNTDNMSGLAGETCTTKQYRENLEKSVENVLSRVSGVGKTKVILTLESTSEKVVLRDTPYENEKTTDIEGGKTKNSEIIKNEQNTILIEKDGDTSPYIIKEIEPVVKGVVVACQYGDNITVKKEIIEAIQVLFGLESHKIKVMKLE